VHRVARSGNAAVCLAPVLPLLILTTFPDSAGARSVHIIAFNAPPNVAYDAQLNGVSRQTLASSETGSLDYTFEAIDGDIATFETADLAPPPPPLLASVVPDGAGCALASWIPSGDPTVVGYVLYAGTRSVASGEAAYYDVAVNAGSGSSASACSLPPGVNYVALRARNYAGVLSAFSAEKAVTITTVAVLFTFFDADIADEGVRLSWDVETDEEVQGYRIYRNEENEPETAIVDELLSANTREFVDGGARSATSYEYVLGATREDGSEIRSVPITVSTPGIPLELGQNAPNPFNPSTQIPFSLDRGSHVVVRVYDVQGRLVTTLHEGELAEGRHTLTWNGRDEAGQPVSSGIYIYSLTADRRTISKKMTLLK
jgi:hypothetical protein